MATLTTVYGDVYPITPFGKIISSIVVIVGIGIVALPAGIIVANYNNLLEKNSLEMQETKSSYGLTIFDIDDTL